MHLTMSPADQPNDIVFHYGRGVEPEMIPKGSILESQVSCGASHQATKRFRRVQQRSNAANPRPFYLSANRNSLNLQ